MTATHDEESLWGEIKPLVFHFIGSVVITLSLVVIGLIIHWLKSIAPEKEHFFDAMENWDLLLAFALFITYGTYGLITVILTLALGIVFAFGRFRTGLAASPIKVDDGKADANESANH